MERSPNETLQLTALHAPGCATREALFAELRVGEHYAPMCQFRDGAGKPQHALVGTVALVTVR